MVYKTSFTFTSTPRIPKLTVVCGPYRYELKDAVGEFKIPYYEGSPCELDRRVAISYGSYDEDDKMATVPYTVTVVGIPPGGLDTGTKASGGIGGSSGAYVFTTEDIIFYPSGFFPIYGSNPKSSTERLYLYGWTSSEYYDIDDNSKPLTIYTKSSTPEVGDETYDSKGFLYDGLAWDGADIGKINTTTIGSKTSNTITIGSAENIK